MGILVVRSTLSILITVTLTPAPFQKEDEVGRKCHLSTSSVSCTQ